MTRRLPCPRRWWSRARAAAVVVALAATAGCPAGPRSVAAAPRATGACPDFTPPPRLGVLDATVDAATTARLQAWRRQTAEQRVHEEVDPARVRATLALPQASVDRGCVDLDTVVDVGRGLFQRSFATADGLGPWRDDGDGLARVQVPARGGPDAVSCQSCHWKGGDAGAGDRVDNALVMGDGDDVTTAQARNPPALWGAGWAERVAAEMTATLQAQRDDAVARARRDGVAATVALSAKGVAFGALRVDDDGVVDTRDVAGVDDDLVIKPFGWKGTHATLRSFVADSLHLHLGLQADELVAAPPAHLALGDGDPDGDLDGDPDGDGVRGEIGEGQLTALVLYLATLEAPPFLALDDGPDRPEELYSNELSFVRSPELAMRWVDGFALFERLGCASCHVPFLPVFDPVYRTRAALSGSEAVVDLSTDAARPRAPRSGDGAHWLVPAFSDFKRHDMGEALAASADSVAHEHGIHRRAFLTRRLWGVQTTSPYLHHGEAASFDEAIVLHGGEAADASAAFVALDENDRISLRLFLAALQRAPALRIR
ncbi:MAG: hypothetical protein FJ137_19210 [Deltaproteobacteria bacterium]|nr:hypothetical protein [Deltaproteobacteria bacterium]